MLLSWVLIRTSWRNPWFVQGSHILGHRVFGWSNVASSCETIFTTSLESQQTCGQWRIPWFQGGITTQETKLSTNYNSCYCTINIISMFWFKMCTVIVNSNYKKPFNQIPVQLYHIPCRWLQKSSWHWMNAAWTKRLVVHFVNVLWVLKNYCLVEHIICYWKLQTRGYHSRLLLKIVSHESKACKGLGEEEVILVTPYVQNIWLRKSRRHTWIRLTISGSMSTPWLSHRPLMTTSKDHLYCAAMFWIWIWSL